MSKWQYKIEPYVNADILQGLLNAFSSEGWRTVSVTFSPNLIVLEKENNAVKDEWYERACG